MYEKIHALLKVLYLQGMSAQLDELLSRAQREGTPIEDVLEQLLTVEYQYKQTRALDNRMKQAKLPWDWTLDTFPFAQQPCIHQSQIMSLAKLNFISQAENIIFIGNSGTGKSGLAMGLLRLALLEGYRGRFYCAQDMLDELYASMADKSTRRLLNRLYNYDLLVIDELGYLNLNSEQVNMFFKLIDMRYRKKPTIITTNLKLGEWYQVFDNKGLVDALLDRFNHYCTTIHIDGPSLRKPVQPRPE